MINNKVTYKKGDILLAREDIIVQQVNCQGVMGSGLARQLRDKYPELYAGYLRFCSMYRNPIGLLGKVYWYYHDPEGTGRPDKIVANIFGQLYYGRDRNAVYTSQDAFITGYSEIGGISRGRKLSVAVPWKIGCGLGNGDWSKIKPVIESFKTTINDFTSVYKLDGYSEKDIFEWKLKKVEQE